MPGVWRERRQARRWTPQELPWPVACRITPGHDARMVDISAVGILVDAATALPPGLDIVIHLIRPARRVTLSGRVVRCFVGGLGRHEGPSFRAGIAFSRWFEALWELDSQAWEPEPPVSDRMVPDI